MSADSTDKQGERLLRKLIGQQATAITFVKDYMQIQFDAYQLSFYTWPVVEHRQILQFGVDDTFEHHLRRLIGQMITRIDVSRVIGITLEFDEQTKLTIPPTAEPEPGGELLQYHLDPDGEWRIWSVSEPPFDHPDETAV